MQDPYSVLGIGRDADGKQIRSRYLELVKCFPPEREPQMAAEIRAAYDAVRDPIVRLESQLFDVKLRRTFDSLIAESRPDIRSRRIPTDLLLSLGKS